MPYSTLLKMNLTAQIKKITAGFNGGHHFLIENQCINNQCDHDKPPIILF